MKHIIVPAPIKIKTRDGEPLRGNPTVKEENGVRSIIPGPVMDALLFYDYAECWWNDEEFVKGGLKLLRQIQKLMDTFDEAKASKAKVISVEDNDWEKLKPIVERAMWFKTAALQCQCIPFIEAVLDAKSDFPAHLQPPKKAGKKSDA